jgi:hypothetical protein
MERARELQYKWIPLVVYQLMSNLIERFERFRYGAK